MSGGLLVAGTCSDAGKSLVVTGLCRALARRGLRVAPFKAQNMALNSVATADGAEIGRAQAAQADAAGVAAEAAMNPVLIKPTGPGTSQLVVGGRPDGMVDARTYQDRKQALRAVVGDALAELRARFDVVVCEGAGSPAETNLRAGDLANLGLARAAGLPVVLVGDIDRGGVLAALFGTLALLEPDDQRHVAGFLVNKFRGDPTILAPALEDLQVRTGRPTYGVVPWQPGLWLDAEDSLVLEGPHHHGSAPAPAGHDARPDGDVLDVVAVRLPRMSNFTDLDPLACEPGVDVRFRADPAAVAAADLVVLPGSKATVDDLAFLRRHGLDRALADRVARGRPVLGICGGYQMLGEVITDTVECEAGTVAGLGLLPVRTTFVAEKLVRRRRGHSPLLDGARAAGYELRHGRAARTGGAALLRADDGEEDGCAEGGVLGTSWHGLLDDDALRAALLAWVAARCGRAFRPSGLAFAAHRDAQLDAAADLLEAHADLDALLALAAAGPSAQRPVLTAALEAGEVAPA